MNLDEAQKRTVAAWVAQGQKLSEIQDRLANELGLRLTYMEVRLLVDDLKLVPRDVERAKPVELTGKQPAPGSTSPAQGSVPDEEATELLPEDELPPPGGGNVSVKVDQVARPGALASGSDVQRRQFGNLVPRPIRATRPVSQTTGLQAVGGGPSGFSDGIAERAV